MTNELPTIDRIIHETDAAYCVFDNGAVLGYRPTSDAFIDEGDGCIEEVVYKPGDFREAVWDDVSMAADPDKAHEFLIEALDHYAQYETHEELQGDWTLLAEVLE